MNIKNIIPERPADIKVSIFGIGTLLSILDTPVGSVPAVAQRALVDKRNDNLFSPVFCVLRAAFPIFPRMDGPRSSTSRIERDTTTDSMGVTR